MSSTTNHRLLPLGFRRALTRPSPPPSMASIPAVPLSSGDRFGSMIRTRGRCARRCFVPIVAAMDEDSMDALPLLDETDDDAGGAYDGSPYMSSEGEESDTELVINLPWEAELPVGRDRLYMYDEALTVTAHQFVSLRRGQKKKRKRIGPGILITFALIAFLVMFLLFVDFCSWRIVRQPLEPFYLTRPFSISAVISTFIGSLFVPLVDSLRLHQVIREEGPVMHSSKKGTPTMGGIYFIPIGIACGIANHSSIEVYGAAAVTLAFGLIGLLDDLLSFFKNHNYGLPGWIKFLLQVAVGTWFSFWLDTANVSTPYSMYTFS
ncbi:hypothetical protein QJS10_CPA01g01659 [Acorus calamus]|uniref:Uncharacterized protein n=1 Tax=Acorus calamus TaxID=4465 RepID=A0AAV9FGC4_ACOCL|nr:hypothetical protein QJS10_CPA01g01659 [Acorus calamus]